MAFTSGTAGRHCCRGCVRDKRCNCGTAGRPCCEKATGSGCRCRRAEPVCTRVALQTYGEEHRTPSSRAFVTRAKVARLTAVHPDGCMLEQNGPRLSVWHFKARLLIHQPLAPPFAGARSSPSRRGRAVRIVAIRTRHHALVDAVLERHVELSANLAVAVVAKDWPGAWQEETSGWRCGG
jgi:hypothetical protein